MVGLRKNVCLEWLSSLVDPKVAVNSMRSVAGDASFRSYHRVMKQEGCGSFIVMDAPPGQEDISPFILTTEKLIAAGVRAPAILAQNKTQGFLLLEDFGDQTFLSAVREHHVADTLLYEKALKILVKIQANADVSGLKPYCADKLLQEMSLFEQWFVNRHCAANLTAQEQAWLQSIQSYLVDSALAEGSVFVHRDYHSRNLMVLPQQQTQGTELDLGVLDHQDAVVGPVSYDVVSLLRDAYVTWPEERTLDWAIRYWEQARQAGIQIPSDPSEFYRQFDYMGLQRHLKVLGIFARLNYRDNKPNYLNDLPTVLAYVRQVAARYSQLKPLNRILDRLHNNSAQVGYTF